MDELEQWHIIVMLWMLVFESLKLKVDDVFWFRWYCAGLKVHVLFCCYG